MNVSVLQDLIGTLIVIQYPDEVLRRPRPRADWPHNMGGRFQGQLTQVHQSIGYSL